jgi:hypothetical protein
MHVDVFAHGGFFGGVFALGGVIAGFNGTAMVCVYCYFGAGERVSRALDELGAKYLASAAE